MKNRSTWILIIILFSIPAIAALFHSGFFQSDDGEWMIIRFSAFHEALRDGQFPVRFLSRLNYGYGYPVANFLYPSFMYLAEVPKILGFGFVDSIKIILGLSMAGSAIFTFLWLSKLFSKWASFVSSLLYLYAPYHLFDLYKRGSVGEILALSLVPFVFWQIERRSFFWTSLGAAFLIISHNSLSLLFLLLIFSYLVTRTLANTLYFLVSLSLGLGLSSFFWIPAIFDLQYTVFSKTQISEWQNYFVNLDLIGVIPFLILVWALIHFNDSNHRSKIKIFVFFGLISLFLSLPLSSFAWKFLPVSFVQFPFRFLSITILATSFLAAFLLNQIKSSKVFIAGIILVVVSFISALPYLRSLVFFDKGDSYYATNEDTTTVKNEYMPIWVKNNPTKHFQEKAMITSGQIKDLRAKSNKITFLTDAIVDAQVTINTVYFPGWDAIIDGKRSQIDYKNNGLIQVDVPQGQHGVSVTFSETPIRLVSDFISLLSVFILLLLFAKRNKYAIF